MRNNQRLLTTLGVALLWAAGGSTCQAAVVRYHYSAAELAGGGLRQPVVSGQATAERTSFFGLVRQPYYQQPKATQIVTFRHPFTGQNVNVPLALPQGTPRMAHARNRIIYDYGSFAVEAHFLQDGSVEVLYKGAGRYLP